MSELREEFDRTKLVLVDKKTGDRLVPSQEVTDFRGEKGKLVGWRAPFHPGSTGRVYVRFEGHAFDGEFYPSVIGAKWVREDESEN